MVPGCSSHSHSAQPADEVSKVYQNALNNGSDYAENVPSHDEQLTVVRRLREALIKLAAIGSVPRASSASLL